jgi:DNA-3-methyladenine glycosylase II
MKLSLAEQELTKLDPDMGILIKRNGPINHTEREDYFTALSSGIISQQISVKAAAKIFERFKDITKLDPAQVATMTDDDIKTIGLSGQKSRYLRDLAEHFVQDSAIFNHLDTLPDDEVILELTKVKGIGVWTAQMFLMFTLVRPDVFAPDDRGLQLAIQKMYGLSDVPGRSELEEIAAKWSPYRTTASWHLWHSLDNEPM